MYNWEEPVIQQASDIRAQELQVLKSASVLTAANMTFMSIAPIAVAIAALFTYVAHVTPREVALLLSHSPTACFCASATLPTTVTSRPAECLLP